MRSTLPAIVKLAERLMADVEIAISRFPRRHRYTVGARLSEDVMAVALCAHSAWREPTSERKQALSDCIDRLKLQLQLGQQIHAFASFGQFELLARTAADLGKQCGGWQRKGNLRRQNGQESNPAQRPQILSSRVASSEANQ